MIKNTATSSIRITNYSASSININKIFSFKVCRHADLIAQLWLQKHNALYIHIVINMDRLNQLPKDDYVDV